MDDSLVLQLRKNQSNLDRMRARLQCVRILVSDYEVNYSKHCGTYADEWEEWYSWALADRAEFQADVHAIKQFIDDLRSFLIACGQSPTACDEAVDGQASGEMMLSLAIEMQHCEQDMITRMDEHISELRDFVTCMRELETNDRL